MARERWVLSVWLAMGVAIALGARGGWAGPAPSGQSGGGLVSGEALYAVHCSSCHGFRGAGTPQGPPLAGAGAAAVDFMLSTGRMPIPDPHQPAMRQPPRFSRVEIDAIIAYIGSFGLGGPRIPGVQPEQGELVRGARLFATNCAPCHGAAGQGASVGGGWVAPSLSEATPMQIGEAMRTGPGPMPKFGEQVLSASDLNAVVHYVVFLQHPPNPGGIGLGYEGPVIEGFVAWLIGLGLMVVAVRLIGTTT